MLASALAVCHHCCHHIAITSTAILMLLLMLLLLLTPHLPPYFKHTHKHMVINLSCILQITIWQFGCENTVVYCYVYVRAFVT